MTLAVLTSRALAGVDAPAVRVETHLAAGLPTFTVVGLADVEVRESRERVRAAILNSGYDFPAGRITVNLSPADLRKESGRFDLPMALGVLLASGQVSVPPAPGGPGDDPLTHVVLAGELSLTGTLVPVAAPLAIALGTARDHAHAELILPAVSAAQAAHVPGLRVWAAHTLTEVVSHVTGAAPLAVARPAPWPEPLPLPCLSDVRGQGGARRALELAAAGGHSLLMVGPPGAGKSMLAQRLPGILPPLAAEHALEAAAIASLTGEPGCMGTQPPFRAPHHTASAAALVGGGARPRPGEISRAHHGVLFLDELPEFSRRALEALREPLETGQISISRAMQTVRYPARFQFVAAMNPCPCGWRGHPRHACRCSAEQASRYRAKVSGPMLDRIDLHVMLPPAQADWMSLPPGEPSAAIRERVVACRERQVARQGEPNAALVGHQLEACCPMAEQARELLRVAMSRLHASARATHRALRVARTAADLDGDEIIAERHIAEAVQYRLS
ncbi:YifB family Mg chelatase-like AAA ATPase [Bordetella sp. LUAb4]|uniref:YifB family Mg chelatase-like AAA ATPase n=1 Tax=Bordetella sp. LUAb4 TaxID=2843195 RepID=UPI001E4D90EA|nr:YifB family Mg chelatase-like AAA ATPase [Bordetella sp. LUAb4]